MNTKVIAVIGLLYGAGYGYGILIEPISVNRSVNVSGSVTNEAGLSDGFNQTDYQQGAGAFLGNVSGVADASNPVIAWPAAGSQHAEASATQESFASGDTIENRGSLSVQTWVPYSGPPYGFTFAAASSVFEITFRVLNVLNYELNLDRHYFQDAMVAPDFEFSLLSPLYGSVLPRFFIGNASGLLLPDTYTLRMNERVTGSIDPLGDLGFCDYNMALHVASVPDSGSTVVMLGAGLCAILVFRKKAAL